MLFTKYKVIEVSESGCSTLFFGSAPIPTEKLEATLNTEVASGWQVVFQVVEKRRFLLFWARESVIVTLGKQ